MTLQFDGKPLVMGVMNVTPDSFSDGGNFNRPSAALNRAREMIEEGVDIIDIGGESTRPGAAPVSTSEELDRVLPVLESIRSESEVAISLDSSNPEVMKEASAFDIQLFNDVRSFSREGALEVVRQTSAYLCIMHMQGTPETMQDNPSYSEVVSDVADVLVKRAQEIEASGISSERIIIDPGFGFGKRLEDNLALLKNLVSFITFDYPVLVGMSRKRMIGETLGVEVSDRLYGGLSLAAIASFLGASIIRTHDVRETRHVVDMAYAVRQSGQ